MRYVDIGGGDLIVLKKLSLPEIKDEWEAIFAAVDRKGWRAAQRIVESEIAAVRRGRNRKSTS